MKNFLKKLIPNDTAREWVVTILVALVLAWFFRSTIASPRKIPTGSMIPTLKIGDHLFVYMFSYGLKVPFTTYEFWTWDNPDTGDIVVFKFPDNPSKDYIKRVIGTPGDRIEILDGIIHINGKAVEFKPIEGDPVLDDVELPFPYMSKRLYDETINGIHHYVMHLNYLTPDPESQGVVEIDRARDFGPIEVPKDHYFVMGDNRDNSADSREGWFVPRANVLGRAGFIWFSINKKGWKIKGIRWKRFFTKIH